ncbi:hypothetical protein [Sphingobium sp. WCS2017Hpa-17]|uniref:hypothetical protein n=1 Tax=Sphingobium sp. WCS2017Hpa-17 TaxID=3073638 RepID=UPI002889F63A|nr:hypothetical protein [Sphingobium sp. WCS2017Hpa-17]
MKSFNEQGSTKLAFATVCVVLIVPLLLGYAAIVHADDLTKMLPIFWRSTG